MRAGCACCVAVRQNSILARRSSVVLRRRSRRLCAVLCAHILLPRPIARFTLLAPQPHPVKRIVAAVGFATCRPSHLPPCSNRISLAFAAHFLAVARAAIRWYSSPPSPLPSNRGSYAGISTSGFRDFLLKPELMQAITDAGFEHPSEVQQECIPQAIMGTDLICQAKSGMGKTAVFVIATLQQIEPKDGVVDTLVLGHTRELAFQICKEFERFSKYFPEVRVMCIYGGVPIKDQEKALKESTPHIVVGTSGRVAALVENGSLVLDKLKRFILDECDSLLDKVDNRATVQNIFKATPKQKQVCMFSATISKEVRALCQRFTQSATNISIDDEKKLTLHGLQQHYIKLEEVAKNRKLTDVLDALEFNQVCFESRVSVCSLLLSFFFFFQLTECHHSSSPPGRHLCQVSGARQCARQGAQGQQLPVDVHPLGPRSVRAHCALQCVQGLQVAHSRLDRHLGSRCRH